MFLGLHSPSIYYSEWQGFHMSALSSEVAGERAATWPRQIRGRRSVWVEILPKTRRPRRAPPCFSFCIPGVLLLRLLFHLARRRRPDYTLTQSPLLQGERVAAMSRWVTGGDDATGGVDR